jgi:hypothetical protein
MSDPDIGDTDRPVNGVGPLIEPPAPLIEEVDTKSIRIAAKTPVPEPIKAVDVRRDEPLMPTKKDMKRRPKPSSEEEE